MDASMFNGVFEGFIIFLVIVALLCLGGCYGCAKWAYRRGQANPNKVFEAVVTTNLVTNYVERAK